MNWINDTHIQWFIPPGYGYPTISFFICAHLNHFFPVSIHSPQCIHCLLQLFISQYDFREIESEDRDLNLESVNCYGTLKTSFTF